MRIWNVRNRKVKPSARQVHRDRPLPRGVLVATLLVGVIVCGTIGIHVIEGWPWFQSFYCTLMSISTVGAQPENQLSKTGQEFNVVVLLLGLGVMGFAITSFAAWLVEAHLGTQSGRRRMDKEISKLRGHFIVCGLGRVGRRVSMEIVDRGFPWSPLKRIPHGLSGLSVKRFP